MDNFVFYAALLGYEGNNGIEWLCGGTLISENFVLTAAHCIKTKRTSTIGSPKVVLLGERNYESRTDKPQEIRIAKIIIHPDYAKTRPYNDIALIKLRRNFTVNAYSRPACLQLDNTININKVIATGWGSTENGGPTSKELLQVELNLISNDKCNNFYADLPIGVDDKTMICAGDLNGRKDTCRGDSGGPLQVKLSDPYCMYSIIGVTSLGRNNKCGTKQPSIFTRVSNYLPWIEKIVWP